MTVSNLTGNECTNCAHGISHQPHWSTGHQWCSYTCFGKTPLPSVCSKCDLLDNFSINSLWTCSFLYLNPLANFFRLSKDVWLSIMNKRINFCQFASTMIQALHTHKHKCCDTYIQHEMGRSVCLNLWS